MNNAQFIAKINNHPTPSGYIREVYMLSMSVFSVYPSAKNGRFQIKDKAKRLNMLISNNNSLLCKIRLQM